MDWKEVLRQVRNVLVIDWPSKEVPETLARAGLHVVVRGGPAPDDYSTYELDSTGAVRRPSPAPDQVELVYVYRPSSELPMIIATAKALNAKAIWTQSGLSATGVKDPRGCWVPDQEHQRADEVVRLSGLSYFSQPYIVDAIRKLGALKFDTVSNP
jgi:predicted CoA-binding protein